MLRLDPAYADKAARISALARDVTEYLAALDLPEPSASGPRRRLSFGLPMQHGQKIAPAERIAGEGRFRRPRAPRGAPVLRLGRNLQHHAA